MSTGNRPQTKPRRTTTTSHRLATLVPLNEPNAAANGPRPAKRAQPASRAQTGVASRRAPRRNRGL